MRKFVTLLLIVPLPLFFAKAKAEVKVGDLYTVVKPFSIYSLDFKPGDTLKVTEIKKYLKRPDQPHLYGYDVFAIRNGECLSWMDMDYYNIHINNGDLILNE